MVMASNTQRMDPTSIAYWLDCYGGKRLWTAIWPLVHWLAHKEGDPFVLCIGGPPTDDVYQMARALADFLDTAALSEVRNETVLHVDVDAFRPPDEGRAGVPDFRPQAYRMIELAEFLNSIITNPGAPHTCGGYNRQGEYDPELFRYTRFVRIVIVAGAYVTERPIRAYAHEGWYLKPARRWKDVKKIVRANIVGVIERHLGEKLLPPGESAIDEE